MMKTILITKDNVENFAEEMFKFNCNNTYNSLCFSCSDIRREQMSDDENRLAIKAICMSQMLGDLSIRAMVRNDNELDKKINKLLRSSNKVLFGILFSEKCNDNELKAYDANLDFTEADIIELRKAYAI